MKTEDLLNVIEDCTLNDYSFSTVYHYNKYGADKIIWGCDISIYYVFPILDYLKTMEITKIVHDYESNTQVILLDIDKRKFATLFRKIDSIFHYTTGDLDELPTSANDNEKLFIEKLEKWVKEKLL